MTYRRFNTIQDDIDLKRHIRLYQKSRSFNTIQDDIDLKHFDLISPSPPRFNTIQDDIDLKPQIRLCRHRFLNGTMSLLNNYSTYSSRSLSIINFFSYFNNFLYIKVSINKILTLL